MAKRHARIGAAVFALLVGVASSAAMADVSNALRAYQASTTAATQVMANMTDASSAKAGAQQLQGAMAQQRSAEAALHSELLKLNLNDKNNAQLMESATTEMAKANEAFAAQQVRILSNPAIGEVVGKTFVQQPPPSKAR
jgi:hypothetical protein